MDQLAKKYHTPASVLERLLSPLDLQHEIAVLWADALRDEAHSLKTMKAKERTEYSRKTGWFERLAYELYRHNLKKKHV